MTALSRRPGGTQGLPRPEVWRELPQADWLQGDVSPLTDMSAVRDAVATFRPDSMTQQPPVHASPSAVLISLFADARGPSVILTRRSQHLSTHQGQVAFPGGRVEPGETPWQAAVRETYEEIGIDVARARRLGELAAHRTVSSQSHIVPYVAELPSAPDKFVTNDEVDRVFSVPLADLARPDTFVQEHWVFADREVVVPMFYLDDETVWGATARMLHELITLVVRSGPR